VVAEPRLTIDPATAASLRMAALGARFAVAQRGDAAISVALDLGLLT
jgi:hypothetical protein